MNNSLVTLIFISLAVIALSRASVFKCLDGSCLCDTDEEVISCHNNKSRTQLPLPSKRLRGFMVLGITNNDLRTLPEEAILKQRFPDLQGIDVFGNTNFDCEQVSQFSQIHILSACDNETRMEYPTVEVYMPKDDQTVDDCNFECQIKKHATTAKDYMHQIWENLLEKLKEFRQHELVKEVESGVSEVAGNIMQWLRDHT